MERASEPAFPGCLCQAMGGEKGQISTALSSLLTLAPQDVSRDRRVSASISESLVRVKERMIISYPRGSLKYYILTSQTPKIISGKNVY